MGGDSSIVSSTARVFSLGVFHPYRTRSSSLASAALSIRLRDKHRVLSDKVIGSVSDDISKLLGNNNGRSTSSAVLPGSN